VQPENEVSVTPVSVQTAIPPANLSSLHHNVTVKYNATAFKEMLNRPQSLRQLRGR